MKKLILGTILLSSLAMTQNLEVNNKQSATGGGNGGDAIASEFSNFALRSYLTLSQVCVEHTFEESCARLQSFKDSVYQAVITVKDRVYAADGSERDATNDGDSNIYIGMKRWNTLSLRKKLSIVVHEHLSLSSIEGSDQYAFSNEIISLLAQHDWGFLKLTSEKALTKSYSGLQAMVLVNDKLVYIFPYATSAVGFCVHKGFKKALSFKGEDKGWHASPSPTHIGVDGNIYGYDANVIGSVITEVVCSF